MDILGKLVGYKDETFEVVTEFNDAKGEKNKYLIENRGRILGIIEGINKLRDDAIKNNDIINQGLYDESFKTDVMQDVAKMLEQLGTMANSVMKLQVAYQVYLRTKNETSHPHFIVNIEDTADVETVIKAMEVINQKIAENDFSFADELTNSARSVLYVKKEEKSKEKKKSKAPKM